VESDTEKTVLLDESGSTNPDDSALPGRIADAVAKYREHTATHPAGSMKFAVYIEGHTNPDDTTKTHVCNLFAGGQENIVKALCEAIEMACEREFEFVFEFAGTVGKIMQKHPEKMAEQLRKMVTEIAASESPPSTKVH
jgi:hypothetical protein